MTIPRKQKLQKIRESIQKLSNALTHCEICPRKCGVDRTNNKVGYCRAPLNPVVHSYAPHHGEEPPLSGKSGSGTIFFSHCNMKCVYCQNYYFSQLDEGRQISIEKLADMMVYLQDSGCHNINLVSPTHFVPRILMALRTSFQNGLDIPIVYNTGGYDSVETIRLLEGIVDIYMPDMRYSDNAMARAYSDAPDYVECNAMAVLEMYRQVGDLVIDADGIAKSGLIIRLLALPQDISGMAKTLRFIRDNIGTNAYLSIMSQYYPTFKAHEYKEISHPITPDAYTIVVDEARLLGLNNGWVQEAPSGFDPKFLGANIKPRKGD